MFSAFFPLLLSPTLSLGDLRKEGAREMLAIQEFLENTDNQLLGSWRKNENFNGVQNEGACILMWGEWKFHAGMLCSEDHPWSAAGIRGREQYLCREVWWCCARCSGYIQLIYLIPHNCGMLRDITSANRTSINPKEESPISWWVQCFRNSGSNSCNRDRKSGIAVVFQVKRQTLIWFRWSTTRYSSFNLFTAGFNRHNGLQILSSFTWVGLSLVLIWWDFGNYFYGPKQYSSLLIISKC